MVALVDQGGARVDPITHGLRRAPAPLQRDPLPGGQTSYRHVPSWEAGLPPLELVVYRTLREDVSVRIHKVTAAVRASTDLITGRLMRQGLVFDEGEARRARLKVCATALAIPAALGLSKLLVGLSRGEPVVLLVLGMAIVAGLAYWQFKRPPLRTRAGDEILARLQSNHQDLRAPGRALSGRQAVMSVALFGAGILAGSVLGPVAMAVAAPRPPAPGSGGAHGSGCGSGCGSTCGGSSDSGDSGGSDSGGSDSGGDGGGSSCGGGCGGGGD